MTKLHELNKLGQSIWLDYIRRVFITSGELQSLINDGLRGVTSNPAIFEKAIAGSLDYDEDLQKLIHEKYTTKELYEELALQDISLAADQLLPVYQSSESRDGFVSLEVSPKLARDTAGTIAEAKRLFERLQRPNVMIKVPATAEGIPAIRELIASGINVNVTLIFSVENYSEVAEAYLEGLERLAKTGPSARGGLPLEQIASVASIFVSRVDSAVDAALENVGNTDLKGKIAIANARHVYATFRKIFSSTRWQTLKERGARVQRPLWASTATKNPLYPDAMYVEQLIGADTVNTVPPATLNNFLDHGTISETLEGNPAEFRHQLQALQQLEIDLYDITHQLQQDGVAAFEASFTSLMESIEGKKEKLLTKKSHFRSQLGGLQPLVDQGLQQLRDEQIMTRLWKHDHTIWKPEPAEIRNRLGWLHSPEIMGDVISGIQAFVDTVKENGFTHALLLGMGGSSLAPEVFRKTFGTKEGYLELEILDSTDPDVIYQYTQQLNPEKTLFIVSTKSGGTVETLSFMKYFYNITMQAVGRERVGKHFIAITDPGSSLATMAGELGFRKVFLNDPDIGGRYSALSYFGLVPAALLGVDIGELLKRAATMACNCEGCNCPVAGDNMGAHLGAIMGTLYGQGRDKLTLITSPDISAFGAWCEQLIAESTGKEGKGIIPVDGEALLLPENYRDDRLFVYLHLEGEDSHRSQIEELANAGHPVISITLRDIYDLGSEFFRWEVATAVAGYFLKINPFDQPNVESAKILAREMVAEYLRSGALPEVAATLNTDEISVYGEFTAANAPDMLLQFLSREITGKSDDFPYPYVALQAYLKPDSSTGAVLQKLRTAIQKKYRVATTVGYGPRFLHSTGQLHKGDAGNGLFIQLTSSPAKDIPIPDKAGEETSTMSFGILKRAQALGDRQALLDNGRRVIRFHFHKNVPEGIKQLTGGI